MRTKITFYGEIAGNIWMPAVECTKAFHLERGQGQDADCFAEVRS